MAADVLLLLQDINSSLSTTKAEPLERATTTNSIRFVPRVAGYSCSEFSASVLTVSISMEVFL